MAIAFVEVVGLIQRRICKHFIFIGIYIKLFKKDQIIKFTLYNRI